MATKRKTPIVKNSSALVTSPKAQPVRSIYAFVKGHRWLTLFIAIIVVLVGVFGGKAFIQAQNTKHHMATYLHDKYGKDFVVYDFHVEGAGFAVKGDPVAKAHPKDDKSLTFKVWDTSDTPSKHYFLDEYPGAVWSREETQVLKPIISEIFGARTEYTITITTVFTASPTNTNVLNEPITGDFGSFQDAVKKYGKRLHLTVALAGQQETKAVVAQKLYQLIGQLDHLGADTTYRYHNSDRSIRLSIEDADLGTIHSTDDIIKLMEEW